MRIAVISDIHANLHAWQAVWADIRAQSVDYIVCLGDIIGYGPRPVEVLGDVHSKVHEFVMGNHEAAIAGKIDLDAFNEDARNMILLTRDRLGRKAVAFCNELPTVSLLDQDGCCVLFTHASIPDPDVFYYIHTEEDARIAWNADDASIMFVGHTHQPCLHVLEANGAYALCDAREFTLEPDRRYIVNVGSVGLPRVFDLRACYSVLDTEAKRVEWRWVNYDLAAFRNDVLSSDAAHDAAANHLLALIEKQSTDARIREKVDFGKTQKIDDWFVNVAAPAPGARPEARAHRARTIAVRSSHREARRIVLNPSGGSIHSPSLADVPPRPTIGFGMVRPKPKRGTNTRRLWIIAGSILGAMALFGLIAAGMRGRSAPPRPRAAPAGASHPAGSSDRPAAQAPGSRTASTVARKVVSDGFISPLVDTALWKSGPGITKASQGVMVLQTRDAKSKVLSTRESFVPDANAECTVKYKIPPQTDSGSAGIVMTSDMGLSIGIVLRVSDGSNTDSSAALVLRENPAGDYGVLQSAKAPPEGLLQLRYDSIARRVTAFCGATETTLKPVGSRDPVPFTGDFHIEFRAWSPPGGKGISVQFDNFLARQ